MAVRIQELLNGRGASSASPRLGGGAGSSPRAGAFGAALAKQSQRTGNSTAQSVNQNKKDARPSDERSPDKPAGDADASKRSKADASNQAKKTKSAQPDKRGAPTSASDSSNPSADTVDDNIASTDDAADSDPAAAADIAASDETHADSEADKTDAGKDFKVAAGDVTVQTPLQGVAAAGLPQPVATPPQSAPIQPAAQAATTASSGQGNPATSVVPDTAGATTPTDPSAMAQAQPTDAQAALSANGGIAVPAGLAGKTKAGKAAPTPTVGTADAIGAPPADGAKAQAGETPKGQSPADAAQASQQQTSQLLSADSEASSDADGNAQSQGHKAGSDSAATDIAPTTAHELLAGPQAAKPALAATPAQQATAQARPEVHFADTNHPSIVQGITGRLMPTGGTMQLRLNPPELGVMQITVNIKDGLMTASFQTSNDQATQLLSHSLHELRNMLESQGMAVQKLQVQQQPAQNFDSKGQGTNSQSQQQQQAMHDQSGRQEQQRKDLIQRMWAKLGVGSDPLDVTG